MDILKKFVVVLNEYVIYILLLLIIITSLALLLIRENGDKLPVSIPKYHFYFIAQNSVDPFWTEVLKGVQQSAKDYNVAVEFYAPRFNDPKEELKYIDIATIAKVDGIITHVSNTSDFTEAIEKAYDKQIPLITIENDNNKSKRQTSVGTNSFVIGKKAAELLLEATNGNANVAVISSEDSNQDSVEQNLKMNGFISTLKDHPNIKIVKTYSSKMGILSAEEITQQIIDSTDKINAIFTVSMADTLGAAQFIVDRNKVGDIALVGYGSSDGILRYIDKGVIFGTVTSDPYKMGYESVKAMVDLKDGKTVSTFIDTEVEVITKENSSNYKPKP